MKVIKHGETYFNHTCSECGCVMECGYHDFVKKVRPEELSYMGKNNFIKCPECGSLEEIPIMEYNRIRRVVTTATSKLWN